MRKSDEQEDRHYFRMGDRFFRVENQWFYTTREGNEGPFNSREQAENHLKTFVAMQELTDEHGAKVVFAKKKAEAEADSEERKLDTTIWDRQADSI